jgi:MFS family permease
MRNRGLAFAFTASPYIITAFGGAPLSEQFHKSNWRWAYGTIAILVPLVATPLLVTWELAKKKAMKNQILEKVPSTRTWTETVWHYLIEFDGKRSPTIFESLIRLCSLFSPLQSPHSLLISAFAQYRLEISISTEYTSLTIIF